MKDVKILLKQLQKLRLVDGILMRKTASLSQIVLPEKFHQLVYSELHENLAHLGSDRVLELANTAFTGPGCRSQLSTMSRNVADALYPRNVLQIGLPWFL